MTDIKQYDGLPFFIHSGTKIQTENLPSIQSAIYARFRNVQQWRDRYLKGVAIQEAMQKDASGAVQNINMMYAYNAYQKFLNQSLLSLRDVFRVTTNNYRVDVERPTAIIKSYLDNLQSDNNVLCDDAILYGCAALLLDVAIDEDTPRILLNRVRAEKIVYDFEQPGVCSFTLRITPELAWSFDFLDDKFRLDLFNKASSNAECVAELRVFVGTLVVNGKADDYVALIYRKNVIYAEKNRTLTNVRAVSLYDKNSDFSPIYTVLKASEISRENFKLIYDYNDKVVNPIRVGIANIDAKAWMEADRTKYLRLPPPMTDLNALLPGQLDVNGLTSITTNIQQLAQQAAGLNDYTLGEATGSVRTYGEAMMLADSASGIMNILASKLKQKLILPMLEDVLEILKETTKDISDIFDDSLYIDTDIVKEQQESNLLMSLINMPMFGAVIQSMDSVQALQLFRWILEKLHISGTASIFDTILDNTLNNQQSQQMKGQQVNG